MILYRQRLFSEEKKKGLSTAGKLGIGAGASLAGAAYYDTVKNNTLDDYNRLADRISDYNFFGKERASHGINSEEMAEKARDKASKLSDKYGKQLGKRNALIVGTGVLATGATIAAIKAKKNKKMEHAREIAQKEKQD